MYLYNVYYDLVGTLLRKASCAKNMTALCLVSSCLQPRLVAAQVTVEVSVIFLPDLLVSGSAMAVYGRERALFCKSPIT